MVHSSPRRWNRHSHRHLRILRTEEGVLGTIGDDSIEDKQASKVKQKTFKKLQRGDGITVEIAKERSGTAH